MTLLAHRLPLSFDGIAPFRAMLAGGIALVGAWSSALVVSAQQPVTRPTIAPGTGGQEMALQGVGVDERFGAAIPRDITLRDHEGHSVRIGDIVDGTRPVVLHFVYYSCATVCDLAMGEVATVLTQQPWTVGTDFDVITVSMDPRDTPAAARDARGRMIGRYGRTEAEHGWHFLVGDEGEIRRLADAVGYRYRWDEPTQQFAHPAVVTVLQESGAVARYLYGIEIPADDLRLALLEASQNRSMTTTERVLMFCFRYDQHDSRYVLAAWNVMRAGGVLTVLALGSFLGTYWLRERRRARQQGPDKNPTTPARPLATRG